MLSRLKKARATIKSLNDAPDQIALLVQKISKCEAELHSLYNLRYANYATATALAKLPVYEKNRSQIEEARDLAYYFAVKRGEAGAQFLQDLWILWATGEKRGGYFVEFGANDGFTDSNTLLLEKKYGWRGILAEPLPTCHDSLKRRESTVDPRCVHSSSGQKLKFLCSKYSGLSGLADSAGAAASERFVTSEIEVETVSLLDLIRDHRAPAVIDYLSVDTEGSEYDILAPFDFSAYRFNFISVEHNQEPAKREAIHKLLDSHGYIRKFEEFSFVDDWYVHSSFKR